MGKKYENKVVIITGAGSGMGRATALELAKEGATVVIADINEGNALSTKELVENLGARCKVITGDISKQEVAKRIIDETVEEFGQIDVLANIAGLPMAFTEIEKVEEDFWDKQIAVNLKAPFLLSKYAIPYLKATKGNIVNISSIASVRPRPGLSAYCASKGGLVEFTRSLALELAPHGVRANVINPGPAETPMLEKFYSGLDPIEGRKVYVDSVPIGRLCKPEDISSMIAYLASDAASFITGSVFNVDGGRGL